MTRMAAALIAVTMLVAPAAASAQTTTPAPAPAPTTTLRRPRPRPAKGRLKLSLQRVGSGGVLAGTRWVVRGTLTPYVAGQQASVRFYRRGRRSPSTQVAIKPAGGKAGRFALGFTRQDAGHDHGPRDPSRDARSSRRSSRRACACRCCRCARRPAPAGSPSACCSSGSRAWATSSGAAASTTTAPRAR